MRRDAEIQQGREGRRAGGSEMKPHRNNSPGGQLCQSQKPESAHETKTIKQYKIIT